MMMVVVVVVMMMMMIRYPLTLAHQFPWPDPRDHLPAQDPVDSLPPEICVHIFGFLSPVDLYAERANNE